MQLNKTQLAQNCTACVRNCNDIYIYTRWKFCFSHASHPIPSLSDIAFYLTVANYTCIYIEYIIYVLRFENIHLCKISYNWVPHGPSNEQSGPWIIYSWSQRAKWSFLWSSVMPNIILGMRFIVAVETLRVRNLLARFWDVRFVQVVHVLIYMQE